MMHEDDVSVAQSRPYARDVMMVIYKSFEHTSSVVASRGVDGNE